MDFKKLNYEYECNPTFEKFKVLVNHPEFKDYLKNPTPEKFGVTPIEFKKTGDKIKKIFKFWEESLPKEFFYLILTDFYISEGAVFLASEFVNDKKYKNCDYKNFPWLEKILEKRKEMFGF